MPPQTAAARQKTSRRSSGRLILFRVATAVVGLILAVGLVEAGLRLMRIGMPALYTPDHFCGSRLRASASGSYCMEGRGEIYVNSLGFRGPEVSVEKPVGTFRIAVLGDSFVEALQVDQHETFCAQLQQHLNDANPSPERTYEIINCGVSGYGTAQELLMLKHHVLPLSPDAVLLGVFPENDIRNNSRELETDVARPYFILNDDGNLTLDTSFRMSVPYLTALSDYEQRKAYLVNCSRTLQVLKHVKQHGLHFDAPGGRRPENELALEASVNDYRYVYEEPQRADHINAWSVTEKLLSEFSSFCVQNGIACFGFTVSSPIQAYPDSELRIRVKSRAGINDLFYSEKRIQGVMVRNGAEFLPLASRLQEVADKHGQYLHGFSNISIGVGHWNQQGNSTAALLVASWLKSQPFFGKTETHLETSQ